MDLSDEVGSLLARSAQRASVMSAVPVAAAKRVHLELALVAEDGHAHGKGACDL